MTKKRTVHVTSIARGWKVKSSGAKRAVKIALTQAEAVEIGRRIASNRGAELIVHRPDGAMRSNDSYGKDPFPPRDTVH